MNKIRVSVIVPTYNSKWDKIKVTLDSIIVQKSSPFEVIIVDDGSRISSSDLIDSYLISQRFSNYKLINNKKNNGTIKNIISAMKYANGKYIKLLAPGDLLVGKTLLDDWCNKLEQSGRKWSFGNALFSNNTTEVPISLFTHQDNPRDITPYLTGDNRTARYNCVIKMDKPNGTTTLFEKQFADPYLIKLSKIITYAEDFIYVLFMLDEHMPYYYNHNVTVYEWGEGISSSNNCFWTQKMHEEHNAVVCAISGKKKYTELMEYKSCVLPPRQKRKRMTAIRLMDSGLTSEAYRECIDNQWPKIAGMLNNRDVWIYGAGFGGECFLEFLLEKEMPPRGFIDLNYLEIVNLKGYSVVNINEVERDAFIIVTLLEYSDKCVKMLEERGFSKNDYYYIKMEKSI